MSKNFVFFLPWPKGQLKIKTSEEALLSIEFLNPGDCVRPEPVNSAELKPPILRRTCIQLQEYLSGQRQSFDLNMEPAGSPYCQRVWKVLQEVPFGVTLTYGEIARRLGSVRQSRAVGRACGLNPLPIVIPCHRVIAASGELHGFSAGLDKKAFLLDLETGGKSSKGKLNVAAKQMST